MQEKPPFSSSLDFFSNVYKGDTPSHTHPLRSWIALRHAPAGGGVIFAKQNWGS